MLKQYSLKLPHAVYGGENAMERITDILKTNAAKKVAIFTDKGIEKAGLFALPEAAVRLPVPLTMCWTISRRSRAMRQCRS